MKSALAWTVHHQDTVPTSKTSWSFAHSNNLQHSRLFESGSPTLGESHGLGESLRLSPVTGESSKLSPELGESFRGESFDMKEL